MDHVKEFWLEKKINSHNIQQISKGKLVTFWVVHSLGKEKNKTLT